MEGKKKLSQNQQISFILFQKRLLKGLLSWGWCYLDAARAGCVGRLRVSGQARGGVGYRSRGKQRVSSIPVPPSTLHPYQAAHATGSCSKSRPRQHYYSLGCVRRMGRQIRGTLRLPESRGGFAKAGGRPHLTPTPALQGLHLGCPSA